MKCFSFRFVACDSLQNVNVFAWLVMGTFFSLAKLLATGELDSSAFLSSFLSWGLNVKVSIGHRREARKASVHAKL